MRESEKTCTNSNDEMIRAPLRFLDRLKSLQYNSYQKEFDELELLYNDEHRMPSKLNLSEMENLAFDANRIEYILKACNFLLRYYASGKSSLKVQLSASIERKMLEGINLLNMRRLLEHIAVTVFNISGSVRVKYKHLLAPAPFTWETFEHLGGLMKIASDEWQFFIFRGVEGIVVKRLVDEFLAVETTVEAAIPAIVNEDILKLHALFSFIQASEAGILDPDSMVMPVELLAIKTLTRRVLDTENLVQLLKYADNHVVEFDHRQAVKAIRGRVEESKIYYAQFDDDDRRFERGVDLTTKQGRHAALRRLEMIGELVTGKYLSSFIRDLDPSLDWAAFNTIRDVIAHQDEGDNRLKVQALLDNLDLFQKVLGEDMQIFFGKLMVVVRLRDEHLPQFVESPDDFWNAIYEYEKHRHQQLKLTEQVEISTVKSRASGEDIAFIQNVLEGKGVSEDIIDQWIGILDGTLSLPDKKLVGKLMQHFPSRKEDRQCNAKCKAIVSQALYPRTSLEERERKREKINQEAVQREAERQALFTGLEHIRALASHWQEKLENTPPLTRRRRVELAIAALENIKEFMEQDLFIQANFDFATMEEWQVTQDKETVMNFFARLVTSSEFNDALEYNAAQLLQHLETIRGFPEARGYIYLDKENGYEAMRCLRNWVEHGNLLRDKVEYEPGKEPSRLQSRQKVVGPVMITLIFKLLPSLYAIRAQYMWMQDICISPDNTLLWRSVNTRAAEKDGKEYDLNRPWGLGYGF